MSTSTKAGPSKSTGQPILTVRGVTKSFPGVRALKGVDLTIYPGEVHALGGREWCREEHLDENPGRRAAARWWRNQARRQAGAFPFAASSGLAGIGIIYQELTIAPNLTVAGNVFLGSEETKLGFLTDTPAMIQHTQEVLDRLGARFRASQRAAHLSIAEQQQIEIARALFYKSRILVMDEPTTALSDRETDRLFDIVRQLRSEGLAIIYISHRMAEIYELGDRLSVFRDGEYVGELTRPEFSSDRIIEMMVGTKARRSLSSEDCRPR